MANKALVVVSVADAAGVVVETVAGAVDAIAMTIDQISLQKQPTIVGTILNLTTHGTTTVRLNEIRAAVNLLVILRIVQNVLAAVVAGVVADGTETKDVRRIKRSPAVIVMTSGTTNLKAVETTVTAMMVHATKVAVPGEDVVVVHVAKAVHATSVQLVVKETIVADVEEVIAPNAVSDPNVQDEVAAVAVHAVPKMTRFQQFHDTARCLLGTMRSQA